MIVGKTILDWFPSSIRWLIRPALFGSIGLHLLLLLLPISEPSTSEDVAKPLSQVKIARSPLPTRPQPTPIAKPSPQSAPLVKPTPVAATPRVRPQVAPRSLPPKPVSASPMPVAEPTPTPISSPTPIASSEAVPPPQIPFADIPMLAGAQTGCYGLGTCHELGNGSNFRAVGQDLESQLKAQGYAVKVRDDLEVAGQSVYEISKGGETRYLNLLSSDLGSTVYVVTTQPVSLNELQNGNALKAELSGILDSFPGTATASATQFNQPTAFYTGTTARPETDGKLRLVPNSPDQLLDSLVQQLQAQNFNLIEAGGYGGGRLYEVTQGVYTGYLNLVPAADGQGTILVLWTNLPS